MRRKSSLDTSLPFNPLPTTITTFPLPKPFGNSSGRHGIVHGMREASGGPGVAGSDGSACGGDTKQLSVAAELTVALHHSCGVRPHVSHPAPWRLETDTSPRLSGAAKVELGTQWTSLASVSSRESGWHGYA